MLIIQSIILGIIQGITEWLPVSSSGHLVIFQKLFGLNVPVFFDILLHLGTLLVVFIFFWKDIIQLTKTTLKRDFKSEYGQLSIFILLGSIPTAVIGLIFHEIFVSFFSNILVVGIALIATGALLFFCERHGGKKELTAKDSLLIGLAQGVAIIPGISRSGSTIGVGLLRGIERDKLIRFSFLLSIPAIIGATIFEAKSVVWNDFELLPVLVGVIMSAILGYFSLKFLVGVVKKRSLKWFSWYCWVLGVGLIIWMIL